MGKQPVRMKAVVYALSPFQQKIMSGLWKDLPTKIHHKVSENWISATLLLAPLVGTYSINKMLSCAGADRLQTGMRGAFGKPQGTCARVSIGQVLLSVRCKDSNSHHAQEALRRAKFKFPGRQKIIVSRKWGFTKFSRADYVKWKSENRIMPDGVNAKLLGCHGPLTNRQPGRAFLQSA
ncbi:hypothetical protein CDL15_Pgr025703 [Punica granatum]|uniref:50S ribosomal protein L16, chloroplastic n=1 Tax=Punica granatum TaxID=22663 RepID=A0A218WAF4_PUNGR|nr:hypothetical protein CDL15_Pgr025703 [Punica granatum]